MNNLAITVIEQEKREQTGILDLGNCGLKEIPKAVFELEWLHTLILGNGVWYEPTKTWITSKNTGADNLLSGKLPDGLKQLSNLKRLYLNGGDSIVTLKRDWAVPTRKIWKINNIAILKDLPNLEYLDLSFNTIPHIRPLANLTQLKRLNLNHNQEIADFSPLAELPNLDRLSLRWCEITDIDFLENLTQLQHIDLGKCDVRDISCFAYLPQLQHLDLNANQRIRSISTLGEITSLRSLILRSNLLNSSAVHFLGRLTNLEYLDLHANQISIRKPHLVEGLTKLRYLDLQINRIGNNTQFLQNLPQLEHLNLGWNSVKDIQVLAQLTNLQSLDLSSTKVTDYSPLENLSKLESLNLSSNKIVNGNALEKIPSLRHLDLSHYKKGKDYSFLPKMKQLESLKLMFAKFKELHLLAQLTNLKHLNLKRNGIKDIEPLLPLIKTGIKVTLNENDMGLNLYNNPIKKPPFRIVQEGNQAIIDYFENR